MKVPSELVGCEVRRTSFDFQVRLDLVDQRPGEQPRVEAELVVETAFTLTDSEGVSHELTPGNGPSLAPVLGLFTRTITTVGLDRGILALVFDDGAELRLGPDPAYESWWLTGHGIDPILVGPAQP